VKYLMIVLVVVSLALASQPRCEAACGAGLFRRVAGVERRQARRSGSNNRGQVRGSACANGACAGF